jgi:hypothetical protein
MAKVILQYCPDILDITLVTNAHGLMVEHEAKTSDFDHSNSYLQRSCESIFMYELVRDHMKDRNLICRTAGNKLRSVTGGKLDRVKRFNEEFDGIKVNFEYQGN